MKPKKAKKNKPIVHTKFPFTPEDREVLSNALDFLMNYDGFSFTDAKIEHSCAFEAANKLDGDDCTLTRGEVRAAAKAVEVALHALSDANTDFSYIESGFPGLVADLKENIPTLERLNELLQAVVKDLRKMK
ncbi:MAG: hypothetical protein IKB09_09595 [Oscillospiraceae bacterium]|nr:hypothetical protein [Oscillospiraceae bacterium]MBR6595189.1 hypothetical protein [Oscillospiraceae bacterium]